MQARWSRPVWGTALMVLGLAATGCVSRGEYDRLRSSYETDRSRWEQVRRSMEERLADAEKQCALLQGGYGVKSQEAELWKQKYADAQREIDSQLAEWARTHDATMTGRGTLELKGDVLFPSGKADLGAKGKAALADLAPILLQNATATLQIAGHTDNEPIAKSGSIWKSHDNMELGSARALAVYLALKENGVTPNRMYIASYGEHRPKDANADNSSKEIRAKNRRVEIFVQAGAPLNGPAATGNSNAPPAAVPTKAEGQPQTPEYPRAPNEGIIEEDAGGQ